MVLSEADHTQSRASSRMGVTDESKDAPRASRPRGFFLVRKVEAYEEKSKVEIDKCGYVRQRKAL